MPPAGNPDHRRTRPCAALMAGAVVGLVAALVAIASCTPNDPSSSPPPTPTWTCTDLGAPCNQEQADREAKSQKAHDQAEQAAKAGFAEYHRMLAAWETTPTPTLKKYYAGQQLKDVLKVIAQFKDAAIKVHGATKLARFKFDTPYPKDTAGATQKVTVCEVPNGSYSTRGGKPYEKSTKTFVYSVTVTVVEGQWKQTSSTGIKTVKSCQEM